MLPKSDVRLHDRIAYRIGDAEAGTYRHFIPRRAIEHEKRLARIGIPDARYCPRAGHDPPVVGVNTICRIFFLCPLSVISASPVLAFQTRASGPLVVTSLLVIPAEGGVHHDVIVASKLADELAGACIPQPRGLSDEVVTIRLPSWL